LVGKLRACPRRLITSSDYFALENPYFDSNHAIGRFCFRSAVIQIGTQGMQWHATFPVPFSTSDFNAVQSARAHYLDSLSAKPHGILHGTLHRATKHDAFFQLLRDIVRDQLRIDFRLPDFFDIHVNGHTHEGLERSAEHLYILTFLADDYTRA